MRSLSKYRFTLKTPLSKLYMWMPPVFGSVDYKKMIKGWSPEISTDILSLFKREGELQLHDFMIWEGWGRDLRGAALPFTSCLVGGMLQRQSHLWPRPRRHSHLLLLLLLHLVLQELQLKGKNTQIKHVVNRFTLANLSLISSTG